MKRCSLSVLSILCAISMNVSAMQMDGAKLISHKAWGADNIKLSFKESQLDQNKIKMLMAAHAKGNKFDQLAGANIKVTEIDPASLGHASHMKTDNWIFIMNQSPVEQEYTIERQVCPMKIDVNSSTSNCSYSLDTVLLNTGQMYNIWGNTFFNWQPTEAGDYVISFITTIQNNESTILFQTGDVASITIPEAEIKHS